MSGSYLIMLSFAALPLALKAMKTLWKEYLSYDKVIPAQALTLQTLIVHGIFLCLRHFFKPLLFDFFGLIESLYEI